MSGAKDFNAGDVVRIRTGAFAAFTGRVVAVDPERERLAVRVDLKITADADSQTLSLRFADVNKIRSAHDR